MNIIVDLSTPIFDGAEVKFRSPVDCSQVTGLVVNYNGGSQEFMFADAHGNNVGDIDHLFTEDVVVKVILDVTTSMAFVQNADTNAYLEGRFTELEDKIGTGGGGGEPYILPVATPEMLGGVKPKTKTDSMTEPVGVDETGGLWTTPSEGGGSGGGTVPKTPQIDYTVEEEVVYVELTEIDGVSLESKNFTSCYVLLENSIQDANTTSALTVNINSPNTLGAGNPKAQVANFSKQNSTKVWACYFDLEKGFHYWMTTASGNLGWSVNSLSSMPAPVADLGNCIRSILLRDNSGIPAGTNIKVWMR